MKSTKTKVKLPQSVYILFVIVIVANVLVTYIMINYFLR
jgi:uncharacterized ion transporter superfamily protein YfcC